MKEPADAAKATATPSHPRSVPAVATGQAEDSFDDPLAYFHVGGQILGDVTLPMAAVEDYTVMR